MLRFITPVLCALALAPPLSAQLPEDSPGRLPAGVYFGLGADILRPRQEFRALIGRPVGVAAYLTVPLATRGPVSLGGRAELFWIRHHHQDVTANAALDREFNGILIGPQLSIVKGPVRPYVAAGFGPTRYYSIIHVDEDCDTDPCQSRDVTRASDNEGTLAWTAGFYVRLEGNDATTPFLLHVSASDRRGGTPDVRTLRDGVLGPRPDARYWSFQIGLSIGGS